ncbi:hypothetical protein Glove_420g99 [Diversispora epigaea]|uniref:MULE transposase domain-containing protein n=1 Tax=Diversispora epigaea TaxID=1348612 RepID=A0A397GW95_9GLOM|nr:hypothetical protein Glove_420g99 [Diversispora epigaea]
MSPTQIALWLKYHDVVLNDNTAKTNPLVSDETTESYKWILKYTKNTIMIESLVFVTDAYPAADATIEQIYVTTYQIHCIFHISENLPKNLKSKLCNQYNDFVHNFYLCRNSIYKELFYEKWTNLIEKYSSVKGYLIRVLYPSRTGRIEKNRTDSDFCSFDQCRQAWARAFTSKIFTAGIQTTSCVEGLNNIIKRELKVSSTLCDIANVLDARLGNESQWNRFFEYRTLLNCMGIISVSNDLFPEIDNEMSKYLTPHILSTECLEMSQCLYFTVNKIESDINEDSSADVADGFIEDLYDAKQIRLKLIIAEIEAMQNFSSMMLIPNPSTIPITVTTVLRSAAKKKVKYGELWGLAWQTAQFAVEHDSYDNLKIQINNSNKENESESEQIGNPLVSRRKGRPETK